MYEGEKYSFCSAGGAQVIACEALLPGKPAD
jgi:hypothetical protein